MRRRRRRSARHGCRASSLIRAALPGRSPWRRRIPLWLFAAGLVVLAGRGGPAAGVGAACRRTPRRSCWPWTCPARCAPPTSAPNRLTAAAERRPGLRQGAAGRHQDRPGRVLRDRRAAGRADHRQGRAARRHRQPAHRPGAPRSAWASWPPSTRSPRSIPTSRRPGSTCRTARPARAASTSRTPSWCSPTARTPRASTRSRRRSRPPPASVRIYTIGFGTDRARAVRLHRRPDRRRRRRSAAAAVGQPRGFGGFGGGGRFNQEHRRGRPDPGRHHHRRQVLPGQGRQGADRTC